MKLVKMTNQAWVANKGSEAQGTPTLPVAEVVNGLWHLAHARPRICEMCNHFKTIKGGPVPRIRAEEVEFKLPLAPIWLPHAFSSALAF